MLRLIKLPGGDAALLQVPLAGVPLLHLVVLAAVDAIDRQQRHRPLARLRQAQTPHRVRLVRMNAGGLGLGGASRQKQKHQAQGRAYAEKSSFRVHRCLLSNGQYPDSMTVLYSYSAKKQ